MRMHVNVPEQRLRVPQSGSYMTDMVDTAFPVAHSVFVG